jgi:alkylation response protein AidB-like acyl-CoA dehydrogenase
VSGFAEIAVPELRAEEYELTDDEETLRVLFADFFTKESPIEVVAAAEPLGFDRGLWDKLGALGAVTMAVPEQHGGGGAGLIELVLAAEEHGRRLAPVPFIEAAVAARCLARHDAGLALLGRLEDGGALVTIALSNVAGDGEQLVAGGPMADAVLLFADRELLAVEPAPPPLAVANLGRVPLGRVSRSSGPATVLATGDDASASFARTRREWQLATASALIGMADECLAVAVDYARQRKQFGVAIGTFQAVSHPLADVAVDVQAGRRLVRKAAWYAEHEDTWWWSTAAFVHASSAAVKAAQVAAHTLGGIGVTESTVVHYLRRVKAWGVLGGDPDRELLTLADDVFGDVRTVT